MLLNLNEFEKNIVKYVCFKYFFNGTYYYPRKRETALFSLVRESLKIKLVNSHEIRLNENLYELKKSIWSFGQN